MISYRENARRLIPALPTLPVGDRLRVVGDILCDADDEAEWFEPMALLELGQAMATVPEVHAVVSMVIEREQFNMRTLSLALAYLDDGLLVEGDELGTLLSALDLLKTDIAAEVRAFDRALMGHTTSKAVKFIAKRPMDERVFYLSELFSAVVGIEQAAGQPPADPAVRMPRESLPVTDRAQQLTVLRWWREISEDRVTSLDLWELIQALPGVDDRHFTSGRSILLGEEPGSEWAESRLNETPMATVASPRHKENER